MSETVRIALIHALDESVAPSRAAFARLWPEAVTFDLLDSSLATDLAAVGRLDEAMMARFETLARYAADTSGRGGTTAGILFSCSAFGPAIDATKGLVPIPVLRPNEAGFEAALARGSRIGLMVTFPPSLPALEGELRAMAAARGQAIAVQGVLAEGALAALKAGDGATHDRLATTAAAQFTDVDVVVLGQFSLARAADSIAQACGKTVVTTPDAAVEALRARIGRARA